MNLFICGEDEVARVLRERPIEYVFSIGDTESEAEAELKLVLRGKAHSRWLFDDVTRDLPQFGYRALTKEQAKALADVIRGVQAETVLVHCAAGISRSSAVAAALLASRGESVARGLRAAWLRSRPYRGEVLLRPNPTVLQYLDEALSLQGQLVMYAGSSFGP